MHCLSDAPARASHGAGVWRIVFRQANWRFPLRIRDFDAADRLLIGMQRALSASLGSASASRPSPSGALQQSGQRMEPGDRRHSAGLMRVNHTGEVCAQALYFGQAALARDDETRDYLQDAAREETDHLAWCAQRLEELDSRPSLFNPLWYGGSFAIGMGAAAISDRLSLGFVVETERQVETHLGEHIERLPSADHRSRAILEQMQRDEARHGAHARQRGGVDLPRPVPDLMALASRIMKAVAYRI